MLLCSYPNMPPTMLLTSSSPLSSSSTSFGRQTVLSVLHASAPSTYVVSFSRLCNAPATFRHELVYDVCARPSRLHALVSVFVLYSSHCHLRRAQSRKFNTEFNHAHTSNTHPHRHRQVDTHKRDWHTHQRHTPGC